MNIADGYMGAAGLAEIEKKLDALDTLAARILGDIYNVRRQIQDLKDTRCRLSKAETAGEIHGKKAI